MEGLAFIYLLNPLPPAIRKQRDKGRRTIVEPVLPQYFTSGGFLPRKLTGSLRQLRAEFRVQQITVPRFPCDEAKESKGCASNEDGFQSKASICQKGVKAWKGGRVELGIMGTPARMVSV